jgi:Survival motor neuron (SMN) interacting protein 1 (SIP1)
MQASSKASHFTIMLVVLLSVVALAQLSPQSNATQSNATGSVQVQYDVAARTAPPDECAASIPFVGDRQGWKRYISQSDAQPYSATLARMDNTLAAFCLRCLADEQKAEDAALPAHTALWMYGLMVRLEKPVGPDVSCILRQVAQLAHARRSTLPPVRTCNRLHVPPRPELAFAILHLQRDSVAVLRSHTSWLYPMALHVRVTINVKNVSLMTQRAWCAGTS